MSGPRTKNPALAALLILVGTVEYWVRYELPRFIPFILVFAAGFVVGRIIT